jgi:hypothetical protein
MRNRRHIPDGADVDASGGQSAHGGFAAGTGTAHPHFHGSETAFGSLVGRRHGRLLRGERSALARAAEAQRTGAGPGDGVAFQVGDSDDGVVEGRLDMHDPIVDDALFLLFEAFLLARFCWCFRHNYVFAAAFFLFATVPRRGPLRVRALVWVRWPRTGRPRRCRNPR